MRGRVVVSGIACFNPVAGVIYQALHYLRGLRDLGWDVYYVEDTTWWSLDPRRGELSPDPTAALSILVPVLEQHGFGDRWAYRRAHAPEEPIGCWGMTDRAVLELYATSDAWINITGSQVVFDEIAVCPHRILVETDPISAQIDVANGVEVTIAHLDSHDLHFTFGETLDNPANPVPLGPYRWLPTRQPVDLSLWATDAPPAHRRFTTVAGWHNDNKDRVYDGQQFRWTKDHEFRAVTDIATDRPDRFEMAVTRCDADDRQLLLDQGWRVGDAMAMSSELLPYRSFIRDSWGEFTVAREQYTRPRTGWFSDRSACYLAAGRPVITQETGFSDVFPTGSGLYPWTTRDDILAAVDEIDRDPAAARSGALDVAREYFAADRVVGDLMHRAGLG